MISIIPIAVLGGVLAVVLTLYRRFMKDWENAKKTGLECIPTRKSIQEMTCAFRFERDLAMRSCLCSTVLRLFYSNSTTRPSSLRPNH